MLLEIESGGHTWSAESAGEFVTTCYDVLCLNMPVGKRRKRNGPQPQSES